MRKQIIEYISPLDAVVGIVKQLNISGLTQTP